MRRCTSPHLHPLQTPDPEGPRHTYETLLATNSFMQRWVVPHPENPNQAIAHLVFQAIESEAEIVALFVCPTHRRKGHAAVLLAQLCYQFACVHLEVREGNTAAQALYAQHGFAAVGVRKGYYPDGENAIQMRWQKARLA